MMSSNYLISTLENHCFYVKSEICLHGKVIHNRFKLDTGCAFSTIPFRVLYNVSHNTALQYKQAAIDSHLKYQRSYGVSDTEMTRQKDKELLKNNKLLECTSLKFMHKDIPLVLNGYALVHDIAVNYDRTSNILIGMDILQDFDFHCGKSIDNGEYLFLGCLRNDISQDYLDELYKHFGYIKYFG
ncbi:MAG: hypothetical protein K2N87_08555 [Eubacterium sp.]|nr:hypothetical protein [Eubacterium sp.]